MGGPTSLVWTIPCPWRPPNVILRSSREHFWEMFLIRRRDDRGSEDRSCTIDNGCFELVERCRYVTGGMKFDLTPLPAITDVSFVYNTPTSFVTLHSSSSSNFQTNFARSRQSRYRWYDLVLCSAPLLVVNNLTPWYHGWSNFTSLDHSMSMETSQRHFTIVSGAFLGNVFDQETRRPWERRSIVHHRQRLF
jgi:hypothetical protein